MILRNKIIQLPLCLLMLLSSCTANFDEYNRKYNEVTSDELGRGGYNIGSALIGVQRYVVPVGLYLNMYVEWLSGGAYSGYWAANKEWGGKFSTFNAPPDWNLSPFNDVMGGFYPNYDQLKAVTKNECILAIGNVCRVAAMQRVTDTYGPIPYSKMRAAGDGGSVDDNGSFQGSLLAAPYDSQEEAYQNLLDDLNNAINVLTTNRQKDISFVAKYDKVYNGNIENWIRYANSLKLRIALRLSYVKPQLAEQTAIEAVNHEVGIIADNSQNAQMTVDNNPNFSMARGGWYQLKAGADLLSYMNGYNDPRITTYFYPSTYEGYTTKYIGIRNGIKIVTSGSDFSKTSDPFVESKTPMLWFCAAEVAFLKAEGALRGWNMGETAEALYNKGIRLSFEQHGVSGSDNYLNNNTDKPEAYQCLETNAAYSKLAFPAQSDITIKWEETTDEKKLERIITQKWIAIYPLANEAWAEFRRTGYPKLAPIVDNRSGGTVPNGEFANRLIFTSTEYQTNGTNVRAAVGLLGGPDNQSTKLWWDKK